MDDIKFVICFKNVFLEIVDNKIKNKSKVLLPDDVREKMEKYVFCKVIDHSRDCLLFKSLIETKERYVVVESHMIERINVGEKAFNIAPETAIVMISF